MKAVRCVLKLAAALAAIAAAVYLVKTYWDTVEDIFYTVVGKIKEKKAQYVCAVPSEFDDYADGELN